jgi:hypothetical protein
MAKLSKIFLPAIVGISVYLIVSKLFPQNTADINSQKDLRGGEVIKHEFINKLIDRILNDNALKIGIISVFFTVGYQQFQEEILKLLSDEVFQQVCGQATDGRLKIVCDVIKEHDLNLHTKSIKELIINNHLSSEDKINLLKIKLDVIINGEFGGKRRFLLVVVLAAIVTFCVSGVAGLGLFLEALYRLFQEGRISKGLYNQILAIVQKKWRKVPIDHLL